MGGSGSGAHYYHWWRPSKKTTVEQCLSLDASRWSREGILRAGSLVSGTWRWSYRGGGGFAVNYTADTRAEAGGPCVRLRYSWAWATTGQQESASYAVGLAATRPRFGGLRWWFLCPLLARGRPCGRRVGKLHLPPGERYFGCRHCHRLTYASCQASRKHDSAFRFLARATGHDFASVKRAMNRLGKGR